MSAVSPTPAGRTDDDPTVPPRPGAEEALLRVQGLSLDYRSERGVVRATHRVDFDVFPSERFVLLGASGCGKSSLLKAVGGFVAPSEGRILIDGRPVQGPGPDRIAVFQEFDQLPPWKTVLENVAFPLIASRTASKAQARERARDWLSRVGLSDFASAYPHQLSGGMKQRVAIARALAMQPRILLMDEPFAALDALTRRRMQDELLALWEQERFTLLFVTHAIDEALTVGHRILLLSPHPGRVRAELNAQGLTPSQRLAQSERIERLLFEAEPPSGRSTEGDVGAGADGGVAACLDCGLSTSAPAHATPRGAHA
ncbi:ABC transporter ATP-binding protein [Roseateles amylovorans]|uniref:ABC transporter ATP-binding protein n=1 Tax=Roseateles amylovorans TaxID=2978473 RepID=A0ABY6B593_9BURK|nr:ABC transporter ATP-binding protein [Roseateles amylovorans]UXH78425.1 ABC transporter ATP-binding protein [Roseateles amylovorans]